MFKVNNKDTKKTPAGFKGSTSVIFFLQKQPPEVFCKKSVLKNFARITENTRPQS